MLHLELLIFSLFRT